LETYKEIEPADLWQPPSLKEGKDFTLDSVLEQMHPFSLDQSDVPLLVKLVENPKYDIGLFAGYVDLFSHDCIHAILGRGLAVKDEAFVIGYTMGSTKRMARWRRNLFMFCAKHLYPEGYKFGEDERLVFYNAVMAGSKCPSDLSKVDFRHFLCCTPWHIRLKLGIDEYLVESCYSLERNLFSESYESQRL
tara:strand:- start:97 stop:669 length:573 start_codon:yes stop_codon:yes gene_type:complete